MFKTIAIAVLLLTACRTTNKEAADRAAREFIRNFPNATGVSCADQDTDRDGYVTCTVFRGNLEPETIQCGSETYCINCARGCKYVPAIKISR